jgi:hypothetical protein
MYDNGKLTSIGLNGLHHAPPEHGVEVIEVKEFALRPTRRILSKTESAFFLSPLVAPFSDSSPIGRYCMV